MSLPPEPKDKSNYQLLKEGGYDNMHHFMLSYGLKPYGNQEECDETRSILEGLRECEQKDWEEQYGVQHEEKHEEQYNEQQGEHYNEQYDEQYDEPYEQQYDELYEQHYDELYGEQYDEPYDESYDEPYYAPYYDSEWYQLPI